MFKVVKDNDIVIVSFQGKYLSKEAVGKLYNYLKSPFRLSIRRKNIAINMKNIDSVSGEFFLALKRLSKYNISLYNVGLNLSLLFELTNTGRNVRIFVNELDFIEEKRLLVNRKFKVVSA